jgi:hypothetical protein
MPWGRLDDQANGSPKLLALSDPAWRMWGCALIYCQAQLTDGFVPQAAIHTFGVRAKDKEKVADELCLAIVPGKGPMWHKVAGGYQIHDYLDWNDSRNEVLAKREKDRKRKGFRAPSERNPSGIHAASDRPTPTPTPTEEKSTGATRRPVEKVVEISEGTHGLYCVIAEEALKVSIEQDGTDSLGNVAEIFKTLCGQRRLSYDGDIQTKAINAVLAAHEKQAKAS